MPELWIYLIILHVPQAFEDAAGLKMCQGSMDMVPLYMQGLLIFLNMCKYGTQYASTMPEYALSFNNVPEYAWKCLNKLFSFDYARVLNLSHHPRY